MIESIVFIWIIKNYIYNLAIIVCAIAMLMSILAIPASAATQDH